MKSEKNYLKEFNYYCVHENELSKKRNDYKYVMNYDKAIKQFEDMKKNPEIQERLEQNIAVAEQLVERMAYFHHTSVESILGILKTGVLLSITEMERRDIAFNYLITKEGINEKLFNYCFVYPEEEWLYGGCQIEFKKDLMLGRKAYFLPKSNLSIGEEQIDQQIMELKMWEKYMGYTLATHYENPIDYFTSTSISQKPEFLFEKSIEVSLIKGITCINKQTYKILFNQISDEFGSDCDYLKLLKIRER